MKTYINGHCIEQILTNVMYLTQSEYDNLSQYDKTHGSYIITDAPDAIINASDIIYDNTTSGLTADDVQEAIDEINENKFDKTGGTVSGRTKFVINGTTSTTGRSIVELGNNIASGTTDNSRGLLRIYSSNTNYGEIISDDNLTSNSVLTIPDKTGTIALTSDIPDISTKVSKSGDTISGTFAPSSDRGANIGADNQRISYLWAYRVVGVTSIEKSANDGTYRQFLQNKTGNIAIKEDYDLDEEAVNFTNSKCNSVYVILCRRVGNVVSISTVINNQTQDIGSNEILATIPERFRPTHEFAYYVSTNDIVILAYASGELGTANISASIPHGWYYPINMVFIK